MATPFHHPLEALAPSRPDGGPAGHRVIVCAPRVTVEMLAAVLHRLATASTVVTGVRTMAAHPCTALEVAVRLAGPAEQAETAVRASLRDLGARGGMDIAVRRADEDHRLVVFDMDDTLVRGETLDRLAARTRHAASVAAITERAMRGDVDFATALRARVRALAGMPVSVLDEVAAGAEPMPGALVAVRTLQAHNIRVGVVTGGFRRIAEPLARSLRLDFCVANDLEVSDGVLTGRTVGDMVDGPGKATALCRFARLHRLPLNACVAVGDGDNDVDMLRTAGLGIAFTCRPQVVAAADVAISYRRLDLILPMMGMPVPCAPVRTGESPGSGGPATATTGVRDS